MEKKLNIIKLMEGLGLKRHGRMDGMIYFIFNNTVIVMRMGEGYCNCYSKIRYSKEYRCYIREELKERVYHIESEYNRIKEWIDELKLSIKEAQVSKKKEEMEKDFYEY